MVGAGVVISLLLVGALASASTLEDTTGQHYQHDGGGVGDLPDECTGAFEDERALTVTEPGETRTSILVPEDDESDVWSVNLAEADVGVLLRLEIVDSPFSVSLALLDADCNVLADTGDDDATQTASADAQVAAADDGSTKTIDADLSSFECNPDEWKFMMKHPKGETPPASIQVDWGTSEGPQDVPLSFASAGQVAMYLTTQNLRFTVQNATVEVPAHWDEPFFKLSHGPCDTVEFQEPTVVEGENAILFMTTSATQNFAQVTLEQEPGVPGPIVIPLCHTLGCSAITDALGTDISLHPEESEA